MPGSRRSRHSRRPSRASRSAVTSLSGTTLVSVGSSYGSVTPPSTISPSNIIYDGSPSQSPSPGPSTAFSRVSPGRIIDDGPPPSYRSPSLSGSPNTATGGGPAASSVTSGSRSIRHMSYPYRTFRRAPGERRQTSSRQSWGPLPVPGSRDVNDRAFTPATVAPSVYMGQGGRIPESTVRPRDSISQAPTRISIRYEPRQRRGQQVHGRYESSSVVQIMPEGHECSPITFPRVTTEDEARRRGAELRSEAYDLELALKSAERAIEHRGPCEFSREVAEDFVTKAYRYIRAQLEAEIFAMYHWNLLPDPHDHRRRRDMNIIDD